MKLRVIVNKKIKQEQQVLASKNSIHIDAENYADILNLLSEKFDGHLVTLLKHDFSLGQGEVLHQFPSHSNFLKDYEELTTQNPWFLSAREYLEGSVVLSQNCLPSNVLIKTDFYQNLLQPYEIFHAMHCVLFRCIDVVYLVSIYRTKNQGCFTDADHDEIKPLISLFSKKVLKDFNYTQTSHLNLALKSVLDQEKHLVLLLNQDGRVIYCNREENFLNSKEIHIKDGVLLKNSTMISTAILNAINSNLEKRAAVRMKPVELVLPIPSSNEYLNLSLFPVGKVYSELSGRDEEVVCITAKNEHHGLSQHVCKICLLYTSDAADEMD
jgi:hypothetical protein